MSYVNAEDVLPKHLVEEIQEYVDGQLIYIPRKNENVMSWGEKNGTKVKLAERNKAIMDCYYAGQTIVELCKSFYLSEKRIQNIIRESESSRKGKRMDITIRPESAKDYQEIKMLVSRSFREGTKYSDGSDEVTLIEEIRSSKYYIPDLSFVAELDGKIVGHFMFSKFPLSGNKDGGHKKDQELVILTPVAVHADYFHRHIGITMLTMGIQKVVEAGYKGILVEGDFNFYNRLGFVTSAEYNIYATSGPPVEEPRCMMCQETYKDSLEGIRGYVVYDMYNIL